jgi:YVTN family beta-propeller protein
MTIQLRQGAGLGISGQYGDRGRRSPARRVRRVVVAVAAVTAGLAALAPVPATAASHPAKPRRSVLAYVASDDGAVHVIDTRSNSVLGIGTTSVSGGPDQVAVTPNGADLYVTNFFKYVSAINIAHQSVTNIAYDQSFFSDRLYGEAITPNGKRVYVAVQNSVHGDKVSVIDTTTNAITDTIQVSAPDQVAISRNGKRAYVSSAAGLSMINTATDKVTGTITLKEPPNGMAITPNGKLLFMTGDSGNVTVINIAKRKIVRTILNAGTGGMAITRDGKRAYVTGVDNDLIQGRVSVIDTATDTVTTTIPIGDRPPSTGAGRYFLPSEVAITPDGKHAYVTGSYRGKGNQAGTVFAIDTATNAATPIAVGTGDTRGVAIGRLPLSPKGPGKGGKP